MTRILTAALLLSACAVCVYGLDPESFERAKKEMQRSCPECHSLRLIESQRLPTAAWDKELSKMIGWGAVVPDRKLLLDYLSEEYNPSKPPPPKELTTPSNK